MSKSLLYKQRKLTRKLYAYWNDPHKAYTNFPHDLSLRCVIDGLNVIYLIYQKNLILQSKAIYLSKEKLILRKKILFFTPCLYGENGSVIHHVILSWFLLFFSVQQFLNGCPPFSFSFISNICFIVMSWFCDI